MTASDVGTPCKCAHIHPKKGYGKNVSTGPCQPSRVNTFHKVLADPKSFRIVWRHLTINFAPYTSNRVSSERPLSKVFQAKP